MGLLSQCIILKSPNKFALKAGNQKLNEIKLAGGEAISIPKSSGLSGSVRVHLGIKMVGL